MIYKLLLTFKTKKKKKTTSLSPDANFIIKYTLIIIGEGPLYWFQEARDRNWGFSLAVCVCLSLGSYFDGKKHWQHQKPIIIIGFFCYLPTLVTPPLPLVMALNGGIHYSYIVQPTITQSLKRK